MEKLKTMEDHVLYHLAIRGAFERMDRYYKSRTDALYDGNLDAAQHFKQQIEEVEAMLAELQELEYKALTGCKEEGGF